MIRHVFASGAKSFLLKSDTGQFLIDALNSLAGHRPFFTDHASAVIFARFDRVNEGTTKDKSVGDERLSRQEKNLVRLLADGHSNVSVAKKKKLSVLAVENMRAGIMRKLQLTSFADLVRYAARNGIIEV